MNVIKRSLNSTSRAKVQKGANGNIHMYLFAFLTDVKANRDGCISKTSLCADLKHWEQSFQHSSDRNFYLILCAKLILAF